MTAKRRRDRQRRRRLLTIAMAAVFAAAVLAAGIFLIVRRADRALPMPEPYSNGQLVYVKAGETAQMTDAALTADLCVGDGNIADTSIELEGDVSAALFSAGLALRIVPSFWMITLGSLVIGIGWGVILLIVLIAARLDILLNTTIVRDAVVIAFCANEAISIVENAGLMGVPIPAALRRAIEALEAKGNEDGEDE